MQINLLVNKGCTYIDSINTPTGLVEPEGDGALGAGGDHCLWPLAARCHHHAAPADPKRCDEAVRGAPLLCLPEVRRDPTRGAHRARAPDPQRALLPLQVARARREAPKGGVGPAPQRQGAQYAALGGGEGRRPLVARRDAAHRPDPHRRARHGATAALLNRRVYAHRDRWEGPREGESAAHSAAWGADADAAADVVQRAAGVQRWPERTEPEREPEPDVPRRHVHGAVGRRRRHHQRAAAAAGRAHEAGQTAARGAVRHEHRDDPVGAVHSAVRQLRRWLGPRRIASSPSEDRCPAAILKNALIHVERKPL